MKKALIAILNYLLGLSIYVGILAVFGFMAGGVLWLFHLPLLRLGFPYIRIPTLTAICTFVLAGWAHVLIIRKKQAGGKDNER